MEIEKSSCRRIEEVIKQDIRNALLLYGLDDMLHFGWIKQTVGHLQKEEHDDSDPLGTTVEAIRDLLEGEYAIASQVVKDPNDGLLMVQPWDLSVVATIERIKQKWSDLDERDRTYLVWLELSAKGREEGRRLHEQGCNPFDDGGNGS